MEICNENKKGVLYVTGTPIGNLGDMSIRAIETLQTVDLIAVEDTRNTIKLLNHFEIKTKMTSYHEYNKYDKAVELVGILKSGKNIALVSDAGMPCISDPGYELVNLCYKEGIVVTTVPSGTAVVSALVLSGFDSRRYIFEGFLPKDKKEIKFVLECIGNEYRTTVFYEAPHHIIKMLKLFKPILNERKLCIVREITKRYEEKLCGTADELLEYFEKFTPKGEMVVVIEGKSKKEIENEKIEEWEEMSIKEHYDMYLSQGMDNKHAMKQVAKDRKIGKRDVYSQLMID